MTDLGELRVTINVTNDRQVEFGHNILNDPFNESMLGDYWCHVIHDSSSSSPVYYGISNVLTVYHPDQYDNNLPLCTEVRTNDTETCADYPFIPYNTTQTSSVNTVTATIDGCSSTKMDPVLSNTGSTATVSSKTIIATELINPTMSSATSELNNI